MRQQLNTTALLALIMATTPAVMAGGLCGNSRLDPNETCDDGNTMGGDGCSSVCVTETGFECSAPYQALDEENFVLDGGFEAAGSGTGWSLDSNAFGTPLCNVSICPGDPGSRMGAWWARFGFPDGSDQAIAEQEVVIPAVADTLRFSLMKHSCGSSNDLFWVFMDGEIIFEADGESSGCFETSYTTIDVDLADAPGGPYNDGDNHLLSIEARTTGAGSGAAFAVDEVMISAPAGRPSPSICTQAADVLYLENFDPPTGGDLDSLGFTQVLLGEIELPWGTTDDGLCGTAGIPPGNFTGGEGEAACIDATVADAGYIESYLCTPELDFSNTINNALSLLVNFQSTNQQQEFFSVIVGVEPPDQDTLPGFETVFFSQDSLGDFAEPAGELLQFPLPEFDFKPQVWICLGFGGKGALLYSQADEINLSFEDCIDEFDGDKLENCNDNCIDVINFAQRDTDNDGYGNACDTDIAGSPEAGQALGNGNDCQVNFLDLGLIKNSFFASPVDSKWNPDADFNGDDRINFEDLGVMKNQFFSIPGPSGVTNTCLPPI